MIYCYDTNTCGNCVSPYSVQCSSGIYSTVSGSCVNASLTQRFQQSSYSSAQFNIIAQWSITTIGIGYQQIVENSTLNLMNRTALVGDILAFKGFYIAKTISSDQTEDYRCINSVISSNMFTCSIGNLSSNNTKYRYLLQVTIIQATQIAPIIVYDNTGNYNVEGIIKQNNVTTLSTSSTLPVIYGINWIEIVGPSVANINATSTFVVNLYPISEYLERRQMSSRF